MDYEMRISMVIEDETKKDSIRDYLLTALVDQHTAGNVKHWNMDVQGRVVPSEDSESYTSSDEEAP